MIGFDDVVRGRVAVWVCASVLAACTSGEPARDSDRAALGHEIGSDSPILDEPRPGSNFPGPGSGSDAGPGSGSDAGPGSGSGSDAGPGSGSGSDAGPGSGSGSGSGSGADDAGVLDDGGIGRPPFDAGVGLDALRGVEGNGLDQTSFYACAGGGSTGIGLGLPIMIVAGLALRRRRRRAAS